MKPVKDWRIVGNRKLCHVVEKITVLKLPFPAFLYGPNTQQCRVDLKTWTAHDVMILHQCVWTHLTFGRNRWGFTTEKEENDKSPPPISLSLLYFLFAKTVSSKLYDLTETLRTHLWTHAKSARCRLSSSSEDTIDLSLGWSWKNLTFQAPGSSLELRRLLAS